MKDTSQLASESTADYVYHKQPLFGLYHLGLPTHGRRNGVEHGRPGCSPDAFKMILTEVKQALKETNKAELQKALREHSIADMCGDGPLSTCLGFFDIYDTSCNLTYNYLNTERQIMPIWRPIYKFFPINQLRTWTKKKVIAFRKKICNWSKTRSFTGFIWYERHK